MIFFVNLHGHEKYENNSDDGSVENGMSQAPFSLNSWLVYIYIVCMYMYTYILMYIPLPPHSVFVL